MSTVLITGGAGFFGNLLKRALLERGFRVVSIDLQYDDFRHPQLQAVRGDIRNRDLLEQLFESDHFDVVFHCAAILAHAVRDKEFLWSSNVDGTHAIAEMCKEYRVPKLIFTSSNCLWGGPLGRPVREDDPPNPVEIYGRSKWEGEKILSAYTNDFDVITFRCPTIIDEGRLGLLAILFEFIDEGRKVWVVGGGDNVYQFIAAQDLIDACLRGLQYRGSAVFNVGSDDVKSFREVYQFVIDRAGTGARIANFPRWLALPLMKIAYALGLSPLGPYQYKMIAENFVFDTSKVKEKLGWRPTVTNEEMLSRAYEYYHTHRSEIDSRTNVSAHRQPAKMGVIKLLKWMS